MYPSVNYWGWNSWNYNPYTYYPYYLNNWGYYNNLYHPYTFNPYSYQPYHGFNNFNPGCNSPFYQQNNHNWKQGSQQSQFGLNKSVNNKTNYTSQKPQHINYSSDNSPKKSLEVNYERPKQDLRNYNDSKYNTPSRNTETRTYEQPKKVEQRIQVTQPERSVNQRPNYETPKSNYRPSTDQVPTKYRPSYNQTPRISSPPQQPSRQSPQPRTNNGGTRNNFGVKGGR
jgi:hypothetical protein